MVLTTAVRTPLLQEGGDNHYILCDLVMQCSTCIVCRKFSNPNNPGQESNQQFERERCAQRDRKGERDRDRECEREY